jgi:prophage antirepressor-like protein
MDNINASSVATLCFEWKEIRCINIDEKVWFAFPDILSALGLGMPNAELLINAILGSAAFTEVLLPEQEGGERLSCITTEAVQLLESNSRPKNDRRLYKWICTEVCPKRPKEPKEKDTPQIDSLALRAKDTLYIQAWLEILDAREHWDVPDEGDRLAVDSLFAKAYRERRLGLDEWVYGVVKSISRSTLAKKRSIADSNPAHALGRLDSAGRPFLIDAKYPEILVYVDRLICLDPTLDKQALLKLVKKKYPGRVPSVATIRRMITRKLAA